MTSESAGPRQAFVWIWLPDRIAPVVAGRVRAQGDRYVFSYGRSYLAREEAVSIYPPELPLRAGVLAPTAPPAIVDIMRRGLRDVPPEIAGALRDAMPDAWGRRVVAYRLAETREPMDEITYMLLSGSDRIGALDFQASAKEYVPRDPHDVSLAELLGAAERLERDLPLSRALAEALLHSASIGGARPKALVRGDGKRHVAKFASAGDQLFNVMKAEYAAMRLGALAGLDVAAVRLARSADKDVLLVERFDRERVDGGWARRAMVSAFTVLGLHDYTADTASYERLADKIRQGFARPAETLRELFGRMTFNVLVGNTDDHARNHAAFSGGGRLKLTPAYDVCPQPRSGGDAFQAMRIHRRQRRSQLTVCLAAAEKFLLSREQALAIVRRQTAVIAQNWDAACSEAALSDKDRRHLWRRQFLNDSVFAGLEEELGEVMRLRETAPSSTESPLGGERKQPPGVPPPAPEPSAASDPGPHGS